MKNFLIGLFLLISMNALAQHKDASDADSIKIRQTVTSFYKWYNATWRKVDAFRICKGKNGKPGPPYMIDWKQAEKYFSYLRKNVPTIGETFIENERMFFMTAEEGFNQNPDEEMPIGFDGDRFTNTQEEPKFFWNILIKKDNAWAITIDASDKNKAYVHILEREKGQPAMLHSFFCGEVGKKKINGKFPG
jgi:hypothetical protein